MKQKMMLNVGKYKFSFSYPVGETWWEFQVGLCWHKLQGWNRFSIQLLFIYINLWIPCALTDLPDTKTV